MNVMARVAEALGLDKPMYAEAWERHKARPLVRHIRDEHSGSTNLYDNDRSLVLYHAALHILSDHALFDPNSGNR